MINIPSILHLRPQQRHKRTMIMYSNHTIYATVSYVSCKWDPLDFEKDGQCRLVEGDGDEECIRHADLLAEANVSKRKL